MSSFTFFTFLALGLAIACTSFGSTGAAPATAHGSCQNECKDGKYCDEKSGPPSCTPCVNCAHHNRKPGLDGCAKSEEECGADLTELEYPGSPHFEHKDGENSAIRTGLNPFSTLLGGGNGKHPIIQPGVTADKDSDDGHPPVQSTNCVTIFLVLTVILAVTLVTLVCVLGRRPSSLDQGSWQLPERRRSGEPSTAHLRIVPEGNEVDEAGIDDDVDVQFYDQNDRQPARNEGDAVLEGLLENELYPPAAVPVEAQQPARSNLLNEESLPLDSDGAMALPSNNIPERGQYAGDVEVVININEAAAAAEEEQEQDDGLGILLEFEAHDEYTAGYDYEFGNDSGVTDNDWTEHHVPQPSSSPVIRDNHISRISNSYHHLFQILNPLQSDIATGMEETI